MPQKNTAQRFRQIVRVFARYGFGYVINRKKSSRSSPENLRRAFEELGPTFIKIGQILSTRCDILPHRYISEFQKLQDRAPSLDFEDIQTLFSNELGMQIENAFLYFERKPAASASVAQAHRALLKDGRNVIVKIQRPSIQEYMEMDIAILKKILSLSRAKLQFAFIDINEALNEILAATRKELNFKNEAFSIKKFHDLNKHVKYVGTPEVVWDLTTEKVLTLEFIDGIKITSIDELEKKKVDLNDIGRKLAFSYFKQVLEDGFFHGDPHPGNLLIKDSTIYYIDFGIMGSFSSSLRGILNDMILSIAYKDIDRLIGSILSIGVRRGHVDRNRLYDDIDYLFASYLYTPLENIKISHFLQDIFDAARENNLRLPGELTLLMRSLIIIEGVLAKISPDIKILDTALSYIKSSRRTNLAPSMDEIFLNSYIFARDSLELPSKLVKLSNSILAGRVKIQLEHKNLSKPASDLNRAVNRLVFAIIVSSLIIGSSLIINVGHKLFGVSVIGITGFAAAGFMGLWLIVSILKSGRL